MTAHIAGGVCFSTPKAFISGLICKFVKSCCCIDSVTVNRKSNKCSFLHPDYETDNINEGTWNRIEKVFKIPIQFDLRKQTECRINSKKFIWIT